MRIKLSPHPQESVPFLCLNSGDLVNAGSRQTRPARVAWAPLLLRSWVRFQILILVILEFQEFPTVKSLETIPASFEMRDPLEFTLSPQPIVELITSTSATLEMDLVSSQADLFMSWPLV